MANLESVSLEAAFATLDSVPYNGDDQLDLMVSETTLPYRELAWLNWIEEVEAIIGKSADGDQVEDGYSIDGFYALWERGLTPAMAIEEVKHVKF